ncbi:MAG TPA: SDR family NAD(P)-dependent oxidoreductase [Candidatus Acidoferrum sp.]|nr:SDR family NAD(P)-dependent oxidoreductase [Candidatus Acidoferrum sp.]
MSAQEGFATYPSLRDQLVLITGGATGIGASLVEHFASQSSQVVFLDIDHKSAEQLVAELSSKCARSPVFLPCDLTDIPRLSALISEIEARHGAIRTLVNNAGNDARHSIDEVTPDYWDRSMAVNLRHQFFASQAVIPGMKKAGQGSIINMSSISWVIPSTGLPVYVTAKAAIVGLTRALAHELGVHNIRVNCVLPGAIQTERQKQLWFTDEYRAEILRNQALKKMILPEEVARLVLFLASDDSSAITSQSYVIDGGWV